MSYGNYFWYDIPNNLSEQIKEYITHEANTENTIKYNQLYSYASYPNIILPLVGGILADKFGLYKVIISFNLFIIVGQGIFTISGFMGNKNQDDNLPFIIATVGRVLYGFGGEILGVCQYTIISKWFKDKELSLALSIVLSISWTGGIVWAYILPPLAESSSLGLTLTLGVAIWLISFLIWIFIIYLDMYADKVDKIDNSQTEEDEKFHWKDIKEFDRSYWVIKINWVLSYVGMLFYNISNEFFIIRYGFDQVEAARIGSNISLISIIFGPIFGYLSDKIGHRITFWIISSTIISISYLLFLVFPSSSSNDISYLGVIAFVVMGVGSTIYWVVLFPMIPLIVKPTVLASAYGLSSVVMNIGLSVGPVLVGALTFQSKDVDTYFWVVVFLGSLWILSIITSFLLLIFNRLYLNGILQKSWKQIEKEKEELPNLKIENQSIEPTK